MSQSVEGNNFLLGDAVSAAKKGQDTPSGYYNLERMLKGLVARSSKIFLCGTCMDARALQEQKLLEGTHASSLTELTLTADKVLVF